MNNKSATKGKVRFGSCIGFPSGPIKENKATCQSCRFWVYRQTSMDRVGVCALLKRGFFSEHKFQYGENNPEDSIQVPGNCDIVKTGINFGCIHHEQTTT